jgi:hypothetical protein
VSKEQNNMSLPKFKKSPIFKLSIAEEVGHSSAKSNTPRPQPHTRFKSVKKKICTQYGERCVGFFDASSL